MPIFHSEPDRKYKKVFAWFPIQLYGPDEWDRNRMYDCYSRIAWLCWVWKFTSGKETRSYYAIPGKHTTNKLLLDSIEDRETDYEKAFLKKED